MGAAASATLLILLLGASCGEAARDGGAERAAPRESTDDQGSTPSVPAAPGASETAQYPPMPADVPVPSGALHRSGAKIAAQTVGGWTCELAPEQVVAFYDEGLPAAGWCVGSRETSALGGSFRASKDGRDLEISITRALPSGTAIQMSYSRRRGRVRLGRAGGSPMLRPNPQPILGLASTGILLLVLAATGVAQQQPPGAPPPGPPPGPGPGPGGPPGPAVPLVPWPTVPQPAGNPTTEAKRVLGKTLFWDEQLSSDDTVSCGTCHMPASGGGEGRPTRGAGPDGRLATADDVFGSPGVVLQLADGRYARSPSTGAAPQVTGRNAPTFIGAAHAPAGFWDGRARATFTDPVTGQVVLGGGGALESQSVGPPLSDVEMAHEEQDWVAIVTKLSTVRPLRLATDLPPDVDAALDGEVSYPDLFAAAFGDGTITPPRIAMAIASYERTLVADQSPFDRFAAGETTALTAAQQRGMAALSGARCTVCHAGPLFTDQSFRVLGLRPTAEDPGLQAVTGNVADRGKFKVPTLRNVALRRRFMHNGQFGSLEDVLRFYARAPGTVQFPDNQDPVMATLAVPPAAQADIIAFLRALTDPRAAAETFPFDRPTLASERAPRNPRVAGFGRRGAGGVTPVMIATVPPSTGTDTFKLGLADARPGARAWLAWSREPAVGEEIPATQVIGPFTVADGGRDDGFATWFAPGLADLALPGEDLWFQWRVEDAAAQGGVALSPVAHVTAFDVARIPDPAPSARPLTVIGVPQDALHVARAKMTVDWRRAGADRLAVSGVVDVTATDAQDAPLAVRVTIGAATVLDAAAPGKDDVLSLRGDNGGRARFALDRATGAYRLDLHNVDLRSALSGDGASAPAAGLLSRRVTLAVSGPGFAVATCEGSYAFDVRTRSGRTTATTAFGASTCEDGCFQVTRRRTRAHGTRLDVTGAVAAPGPQALPVTGDIVLAFGDAAVIAIPATSLRSKAAGTKVAFAKSLGRVPGLSRLKLDTRTGVLSVSVDIAGDGTAPLGLEYRTLGGLFRATE